MKTLHALLLILFAIPSLGQQVANFKLVNVMNDQTVSLDTYPSCEGMVIIFTTNACPYDEYYRSRLAKLAQTYNNRVPFLLVNSNADPADSQENMAKKAKQLNLSIPYLADKDQMLMAQLDARKSPEAFLLQNNNGKFSVVYKGAIDDNPQVESDVRQNYLRDAIDIILNRQKIETSEVRATGCNLKRK